MAVVVDTAEELRAVYNEAKKASEGKGRSRRASIFKQTPYIQPDWVQKYFCRFVHIASSLASQCRPEGLSAVLLILMETRSLVLDVYDMKKEAGDSSAKILEQLSTFVTAVQKLENVVAKMGVPNLIKLATEPSAANGDSSDGKEHELPLLVLAPHLMLDQRLFPPKDHPGGGDHSELFALCPDIALGKKLMRICLQQGFDDLTCLLLTANGVGTLTMEILDKTNLRHRYYDRLSSCFSFCRMLAWAEVRRSFQMDLAKSKEWTEKVAETPSLCLGWAFEANALAGGKDDMSTAFEEAVVIRRRASSVSREPSQQQPPQLSAPPSPVSTFQPAPPSPSAIPPANFILPPTSPHPTASLSPSLNSAPPLPREPTLPRERGPPPPARFQRQQQVYEEM